MNTVNSEPTLDIKILGPGCANCELLNKLVKKAIESSSIHAHITKLTDPSKLLDYDMISTPGLVINNKAVTSGRIPSLTEITKFLQEATS